MRIQLNNYSAVSTDDIDEHLLNRAVYVPPFPEPEPDDPPAPLDIWQTIFFGLAFTAAVGGIVNRIVERFNLLDPGMAMLALFSVYLPCFFQYLLQVCVLALPKSHEPLREVIPYMWELLNVAFMCMAAANTPSCTSAFLLHDEVLDISQCSAFSYLMFALRALTFLFYALYRWTHHLSKREQFDPSVSSKANTAYLMSRGLTILAIGCLWLMNGIFQQLRVYDKAAFVGTWWAVIVLDVALVHFGSVTSLVGRHFGPSNLFKLSNLLGAFNLFFGSVLAFYIIAATLFSPVQPTSYILSGLIVCIAFLLAPSYKVNFLKGWLLHHEHNHAAKIAVCCVWALAHIVLFVSVIASGTFYMIAMNRDLSSWERWYMCTTFSASIISLTAISSADIISLYTYSKHMMRIAQHSPSRVVYMNHPVHQFMSREELLSLRFSPMSNWGSFFVSLGMRMAFAGLILLLPLVSVDKLPLWILFLAITLVSLMFSLSSPIYVGYLLSLCRKGVTSELLLKWFYAFRNGKIGITHQSSASHLRLPTTAFSTESESD